MRLENYNGLELKERDPNVQEPFPHQDSACLKWNKSEQTFATKRENCTKVWKKKLYNIGTRVTWTPYKLCQWQGKKKNEKAKREERE